MTVKAKEAADSLNAEYLEVSNLHQEVKTKLSEFKEVLGKPDYYDLAACLAILQKSSSRKSPSLELKTDGETEYPVKLEGGSSDIEAPISLLNEALAACHQFLSSMDFHTDRIRDKIRDLRKLAVSQHILDICSTFEVHASTNIDVYAMEVRTVLLDIRRAGQNVFKH